MNFWDRLNFSVLKTQCFILVNLNDKWRDPFSARIFVREKKVIHYPKYRDSKKKWVRKELTTLVTKETNNVTVEIDRRSDSDKVSSGFSARGGWRRGITWCQMIQMVCKHLTIISLKYMLLSNKQQPVDSPKNFLSCLWMKIDYQDGYSTKVFVLIIMQF